MRKKIKGLAKKIEQFDWWLREKTKFHSYKELVLETFSLGFAMLIIYMETCRWPVVHTMIKTQPPPELNLVDILIYAYPAIQFVLIITGTAGIFGWFITFMGRFRAMETQHEDRVEELLNHVAEYENPREQG